MTTRVDADSFARVRVLVVGDIMLDRYLWGDVSRISPEAPVPVVQVRRQSEVCGGAGNVLANLMGLGCWSSLISVCGRDVAGGRIAELLTHPRVEFHLLENGDGPTVTKTRVIARTQQLLRLDEEVPVPLKPDLEQQVLELAEREIRRCGAVVLSDYGKGVLQGAIVAPGIIRMAREAGVPILVDPKGRDWNRYCGATCVTPNTAELESASGGPIESESVLAQRMRDTLANHDLSWLLVTRGPRGMCLMHRESPDAPISLPSVAREVYDVSGAGDTVIATLAAALAAGSPMPEAARVANVAAGVVVGKLGTQPIALPELLAARAGNDGELPGRYVVKMATLQAASVRVQAWKARGSQVVFTNGCFDLLHPGHIHLLNRARDMGDHLIVGLNSDASVRRIKGEGRPILAERDRATLLGSLDCVDLVVVFDEDTPEVLLRTLMPDVLVKGANYAPEDVVGGDIVAAYGGHIGLVPVLAGHSSTGIRERLRGSQPVASCIAR